MRFTVENAREFSRKGNQKRWHPDPIPVIPSPEPVAIEQAIPEPVPDPFIPDLSCACVETLTLLRKAREPIHRAQLARALRDLRETWHLATGKPRPGLTRPDKQGPTRAPMPRVYPNVYSPDPPTGKPS